MAKATQIPESRIQKFSRNSKVGSAQHEEGLSPQFLSLITVPRQMALPGQDPPASLRIPTPFRLSQIHRDLLLSHALRVSMASSRFFSAMAFLDCFSSQHIFPSSHVTLSSPTRNAASIPCVRFHDRPFYLGRYLSACTHWISLDWKSACAI